MSAITMTTSIRLLNYRPVAVPPTGGINNYIYSLQSHLARLGLGGQIKGAEVRRVFQVQPYQSGEILHIPLIMGSQVLLHKSRFFRSIVTVHDLGGVVSPLDRQHSTRWQKLVLALAVQGLRRADHIITDSAYTKAALLKYLNIPATRVSVIHLGVEHTSFYPQPQKRARQIISERLGLNLNNNQPVLLYVGSELPRKNLNVLWQALTLIRQTYPQATVLKIGKAGSSDGREKTQQAIAAAGQREAVTFLDDVDTSLLAMLYNAADIVIQPSLYEGFSLPTVEAMACGRPVLAANATCLPEVVGNGGRLFDPSSSAQLAEGVLSLMASPIQRQVLEQAATKQAAQFDWNTTAQKTWAVYQAVS